MPTLLSIAGFDPSAGAGVSADLETFRLLGCSGGAVITAIAAQNRSRVWSVHPLLASWVREQALAWLAERRPAAIKIGMLGNASVVREVVGLLKGLSGIPIVLDPVLRASAGAPLLDQPGIKVMVELLFPMVTVLKPNANEAGRILHRRIHGEKGMIQAAKDLRLLGPEAVVITGGDRSGDPIDVFCDSRGVLVMHNQRIPVHAHGTGCRYSSAVAAFLARGWSIRHAVSGAQDFVKKYLRKSAG